MKYIVLLTALLLFFGCEEENNNEQYKYQLIYNGCDTGEHTFATKKAMCEGLQDDNLNGNCSHGLREQKYIQEGCEDLTGNQF